MFGIHAPALPPEDATAPDFALARRHSPILCVDLNEPAPPLAMGYSVIRQQAVSASSKFTISPPQNGAVIEYAIWHDWDIQHLYDLEHVWVHIDADGTPVRVEGTMHGMRVCTDTGSGLPDMKGPRPVLYCEPGKHAIWAQSRPMPFVAGAMIRATCGAEAGAHGIHLGNRFANDGAYTASAFEHRLARLAMRRAAFVPSFNFTPAPEPALLAWATLAAWIPERVNALIAALPTCVPHVSAVFLDCGDTLIDETTEEKRDGTEVVLKADEIPHAMDAVRELHALGYPLALVADGPRASFENLLKPRGIWDLMQAHVISEDVGALKPSPKMFETAMQALGLPDSAKGRVVMVGNNLMRDIRGANQFGLNSLFVAWSKKRTHQPEIDADHPDARIDTLDRLVNAIDAFELSLGEGQHD